MRTPSSPSSSRRPARGGVPGFIGWAQKSLFGSWLDSLLTVAGSYALVRAAGAFYNWAWRDAAFGTTPEACEGATGACWAVIGDFWRVFLLGLYPAAERWRAYTALGVLAVTIAITALSWRRRRYPIYSLWPAAAVAIFVLVRGGWLGLPVVPTRFWGGLLITIGLSGVGLAAGIPLGVLLALARRSTRLPVIKGLAVAFIELVRSVPFVLVLIVGTILLPMFLPTSWDVDLLLRAQIAVLLSAAANSAEIVRGGMAAIGPGQEEAARAIGLGYWHRMGLVILPQALRVMIPVFASMFIVFLKDTSLVVVVGLVDLLGAASLATGNPAWAGRRIETYVFVGAIYFVMCFSISRVTRRFELRLSRARA